MSVQTPPLAFINPSTSVDVPGTGDTILCRFQQHNFNTAFLTANNSWTNAIAPATTAAQLLPTAARNQFILSNPTDGIPVYIGNASLTAATGWQLYPGNYITVERYIGPLWVLSTGGAQAIFYQLS